jgi:hypothetical protein
MSSTNATAKDDALTLISVSAFCCVLQDVLHEGLGHGVVAYFSGAHSLTIDAAGTIVNLIAGAIFLVILRFAPPAKPVTRYFLVLATAGNLFTSTGYFFFSGVTNFGDWASFVTGLQPHWAWQLGLVMIGAAAYYASMLLIWASLVPYLSRTNRGPRLRRLCWAPYFTDGILSGIAGVLNPAGIFYVIASALPSTLGANMGLLVTPFSLHPRDLPEQQRVGPITRSATWIVAGAISAVFFVVLLGRGIHWSR